MLDQIKACVVRPTNFKAIMSCKPTVFYNTTTIMFTIRYSTRFINLNPIHHKKISLSSKIEKTLLLYNAMQFTSKSVTVYQQFYVVYIQAGRNNVL